MLKNRSVDDSTLDETSLELVTRPINMPLLRLYNVHCNGVHRRQKLRLDLIGHRCDKPTSMLPILPCCTMNIHNVNVDERRIFSLCVY